MMVTHELFVITNFKIKMYTAALEGVDLNLKLKK